MRAYIIVENPVHVKLMIPLKNDSLERKSQIILSFRSNVPRLGLSGGGRGEMGMGGSCIKGLRGGWDSC